MSRSEMDNPEDGNNRSATVARHTALLRDVGLFVNHSDKKPVSPQQNSLDSNVDQLRAQGWGVVRTGEINGRQTTILKDPVTGGELTTHFGAPTIENMVDMVGDPFEPDANYNLILQEIRNAKRQLGGNRPETEKAIIQQRLNQLNAIRDQRLQEARAAGILVDVDDFISEERRLLDEGLDPNNIDRTDINDLLSDANEAILPAQLQGIRRSYYDDERNQLIRRVLEQRERERIATERPNSISEEMPFLPTINERRAWINNQLELREEQDRRPFSQEELTELLTTLQQNIIAQQELVARDSSLTNEEKIARLQMLASERSALTKEVQGRWWLQNIHLHMLQGEFDQAIGYFNLINTYLPVLSLDLPQVRQALDKYADDDHSYYRKKSQRKAGDDPNNPNNETKGEWDKKLEDDPEIGKVGNRLAKRILNIMGVSVTNSIVLKDQASVASHLRSLRENLLAEGNQQSMIDKIRQLPWETQIGLLNLKDSFNGVPTDFFKVLYPGWTWERTRQDDENKAKGHSVVPRFLPTVIRDLLPQSDYLNNYLKLARVKKDADVINSSGNVVRHFQPETAVSSVVELANRIVLARGQLGDSTDSGAEADDVITAGYKDAGIEGPGIGFALQLNAFNGAIKGIEESGVLKSPSPQNLVKSIEGFGKLPLVEQEYLIKIFSINVTKHLTQSRHSQEGLINYSDSVAAAIFEELRASRSITPELERDLKIRFFGRERGTLTMKQEVSKLFDFGGSLWAVLQAFLSALQK